MRTILAALGLCAALTSAAHAHPSNVPLRFTLAAGTYALRSLCPPAGQADIKVFASDGNTVLGEASDYCISGRTGATFTVLAAQRIIVMTTFDRLVADIRLRLNRDCPDDPTTTCAVDPTNGTAAGVITYPGDIDWFILPGDFNNISFQVPPGCFAVGKEVNGPIDPTDGAYQTYLAVFGGPSACTYTVTARKRPQIG